MVKKKSDVQLKKSLFAFFDGEANDLELHRVLMNFRTTDLHETAKRYQIISNTLRKKDNKFTNIDISDRVAKAIENEPVILAPKNKFKFNLNNFSLNSFSKLAVAASITLAVIFGVRHINDNEYTTTQQHDSLASHSTHDKPDSYKAHGVLAGSSSSLDAPNLNTASSQQLTKIESIAQQTDKRLQAYSLHHAKAMITNNIYGLISILRAIE